jgi:hypothetical protein
MHLNRYLWLVVISVLLLTTLGIYHLAFQILQPTPNSVESKASPPSILMAMDLTSVQNLNVGVDKQSGFTKLVLHQGDVGSFRMTFTRQDATEKVLVNLCLYGIAPKFEIWENMWDQRNMSLPRGVTCSICPHALELSTDSVRLVNLGIVASPDAQVGDFKLIVDAWFFPSGSGNGTSGTFTPFMLEILPKT